MTSQWFRDRFIFFKKKLHSEADVSKYLEKKMYI